jgi:hypothetical protein
MADDVESVFEIDWMIAGRVGNPGCWQPLALFAGVLQGLERWKN